MTESSVEAGTIGREGGVGMIVGAGSRQAATRGVVADPPAARGASRSPASAPPSSAARLCRDLVHRYTEALLAQVLQSVACNALHSVEQRFCRWLAHLPRSHGLGT